MARRDIAGLLTGIPSSGGGSFAEVMTQGARQMGGLMGRYARGAVTGDSRSNEQRLASDIKNFSSATPEAQKDLIGRLQASGESSVAAQLLGQLKEKKTQEQALQGKVTVLQSLKDLGLNEEAGMYANNGLTDAQASNLVLKERSIQKVAKGTKNQQLSYLINQGVSKDDPLYQDIDAGLKLSESQLSSALKQRNKSTVPEYSSKNLKLMNVEGVGQQNVGTYTIDDGQGKQEVFGYMDVTPEGNLGLIPVDPNAVSSSTTKGIDISGTDINRAHLRLSTAGSRLKGEEKKWLLGAFSTDWNEAWEDLSADDKNTISTLVAQETKRNQQERKMDFVEAEETAIKEVFVDKLRKSKFFEFGEAEVMTPDEITKKEEKDLAARLNKYQ